MRQVRIDAVRNRDVQLVVLYAVLMRGRAGSFVARTETGTARTCYRPCVQIRGELPGAASCLVPGRTSRGWWKEPRVSTNPKIAIGLLSPVGLLFALPLLLWAFSFTELFGQEKCSIGSISDAEYQRVLSRAGAQRWTVWPGLSNGLFWPSDRGLRGPTALFNSNQNDQLLSHIRELAGPDPSVNRQLAPRPTLFCAAWAPNTSKLRKCRTLAGIAPVRVSASLTTCRRCVSRLRVFFA